MGLMPGPGSTPLSASRVKIRRHAPVVSRTKGAVRQRQISCPLTVEKVGSAMNMNLVKHVPNTMQNVSDYEHDWQSNSKEAENCEHNYSAGFELPGSFMPEVSGKRQIEPRDCNEEQGKEGLLYFCRE